MSPFTEVDAFFARAYPGSTLSKESPFVDIRTPNYRKLRSRTDPAVAHELMRESCFLVSMASDPRPFLSALDTIVAIDAVEQRRAHFFHDYAMAEETVQWAATIRGRFDLDAFRHAVGLGTTLLIAPVSERMIDQCHMSFFASSAEDLARVVAAYPESFLSPNYR